MPELERSQRLIHLSEEHATALKLAMAVRALRPEGSGDLRAVASRVREIFEKELLPHFADEERFVVPRLQALDRHDLVQRMRDEHNHMNDLVTALAEPCARDLRAFCTALTEHVCFEENIVWEVLEPGVGTPFEIPAE